MCKLFNENEAAIREYCEKNGLNFDVVDNSPMCFDSTELKILHYEEKKEKKPFLGINEESPCPVLLKILKTPNGLLFEQTEHTARYLAV